MNGTPLDLYAVLGVSRDATKEQIGKSYRKLALRNHPDKVAPSSRESASERFRKIAQAYEVLKDDARRELYDETGFYDSATLGPATPYDTFVDSFFGDEARGSDGRSSDYTYYSLANYDRLTLQTEDLPPYMHDIVKVGLNYLTRAVEDLEARDIVFLRHQRVDILYVMVAYFGALTQKSFDDGYIIHYYDNPLQAGILPAWSDQNVLGGGKKVSAETRQQRRLTAEQYERRQQLARAALTGPDRQAALEEKYERKALAERQQQAGGVSQIAQPPEVPKLGGEDDEHSKPSSTRPSSLDSCLPFLRRWLPCSQE